MNRVAKSKTKYLLLLILLIGLIIFMKATVFDNNSLIFITILALFLIPGRIQGIFYRKFFVGRRLMTHSKLQEALLHLNEFLSDIRKHTWKKKLIWLSWGIYSSDIEAMTLNNIGIIHLKLGELTRAREYFELAVMRDVEYPIPFYNLAIVYSVLGDRERVSEYLKISQDLGYSRTSVDELINKGQEFLSFIEGRKGS